MKVDVHAHLYPPRYLEAVERLTAGSSSPWTDAVRRILTNKIAPNARMTEVAQRIEAMDEAGVDVQILSLSIPHAYFDDPAVAVALASLTNDLLAEVKAANPARFRAFAVLPLPHVDASLHELDRALGPLGLDGVTLGANIGGRHVDDPAFAPVYEALDARSALLFLHPMIPPGQEDLADYDLSSSVGFHLDTTAAVLRLVYSGIVRRSPGMHVIVPHLGAFIPYVWDRIESSYRTRPEAQEHIDEPPTAYLRRMYYDSVNFHRPAWDCALATVGAERLMLGSDYPFALGSMTKAVAVIDDLPIDAEAREAIFGGTVMSLLER